jgi:hypothetical protein
MINKGGSADVVVRLWAGRLRNGGFDYGQERPPHPDVLWAILWVEVGHLYVVSRSGHKSECYYPVSRIRILSLLLT